MEILFAKKVGNASFFRTIICRGFAGDPQAQIASQRELDKSRSRKRPTFGAPLVAVTLPRDARCPRRTVAAAFFVSARSDPLRSLPAPASIRSAPHHSHYQRKSSALSFLRPFEQSVASAMAASLPANVTVCSHACIRVKLSKLRSSSTPPKETKSLVHELTLLLAADALSRALTTTVAGQDVSPLGRSFDVHRSSPERIVIVPILRSGLAMVEGTPCPSPPPNTSIPSHPSAITHTRHVGRQAKASCVQMQPSRRCCPNPCPCTTSGSSGRRRRCSPSSTTITCLPASNPTTRPTSCPATWPSLSTPSSLLAAPPRLPYRH